VTYECLVHALANDPSKLPVGNLVQILWKRENKILHSILYFILFHLGDSSILLLWRRVIRSIEHTLIKRDPSVDSKE
jgi:hypothetical protein